MQRLSYIALIVLTGLVRGEASREDPKPALYARANLMAWCIVPFDAKKRGPVERVEMLERLGFKHYAYDWRAEHLPTFDQEVTELEKRGIALDAVWFPAALNDDAKQLLAVIEDHGLHPQLWITMGDPLPDNSDPAAKVDAAAAIVSPIAEEAARLGCRVELYNHGGWFGEPENQLAIIEKLDRSNIGIVYNLHHGHDQLERFPALLALMLPHLDALNLNGMDAGGDRVGRKILPLGQGERDEELLRTIAASGYRGPIGILGHTDDDAEARLSDNLDGLDWLLARLDGRDPGPPPTPRTPIAPRPGAPTTALPPQPSPELLAREIAEAREHGDSKRGAKVFAAATVACASCHRVGGRGGTLGPDLSLIAKDQTPEQVVESLYWPKKQVKEGFSAVMVAQADGTIVQGYPRSETAETLVLHDPAASLDRTIAKAEIDERREVGSLMPDGLANAIPADQRRDLVRFLLDLGTSADPPQLPEDWAGAGHVAAANFPYVRDPLDPAAWPSWQAHINRDRLYDFYAKEAEYFRTQPTTPALLPEFPGVDGGAYGHWGNQNEELWADGRWNDADLGNVLAGIFRAGELVVPKGVCVRLGEEGQLAACFNPRTLRYEAVWSGGFVKFSSVRHGFMEGLQPVGTLLPVPDHAPPDGPKRYLGFFRHGKRVLFFYRVGDGIYIDSPWVDDAGNFTHTVALAHEHPLRHLTSGGPTPWPEVLETKGTPGQGSGPYVVDTIAPPFDNPWKAPLFFGGHDFLPDGSAVIGTMQGDVWRVDGLDHLLERVRWRRIASGLSQVLGVLVVDGFIHTLGRDQITKLVDLNGDGVIDRYDCVSNAYETSVAGHDFICGLERDANGDFLTVSGNQGLIRVPPGDAPITVLATGFRNPDGLGVAPDGLITVPCSEGEWTPASMICAVRPEQGGHFGYRGMINNQPPDLPFVYLPRGLDNSSGGQAFAPDDPRFGPLAGQMLHLTFGAGGWFLVLRDDVHGRAQGAAVPMPGEFRSGAHRGRFNPADGQFYVSGMSGWGSYTTDDGSFARVRYTGAEATLPVGWRAHQNGVLVRFNRAIDASIAADPRSHFVQAWNYRYGPAYGSAEYSSRHPGVVGHDPLAIAGAHVVEGGRALFLELPDLQPVNQLHLHLGVGPGTALDLYATVNELAEPFTAFAGYRPVEKTIAAHPILGDLARAVPVQKNPWRKSDPDARPIEIEAGKNLTYTTPTLRAKAGEHLRLTFINPDVVPHNWVLIEPGTLAEVGTMANQLVADPAAFSKHYVPETDRVLVYTDLVEPRGRCTVSFVAPTEPGRYPFLCTFPGHWMVMNGQLVVEPAESAGN